jgi:hypothetical protein
MFLLLVGLNAVLWQLRLTNDLGHESRLLKIAAIIAGWVAQWQLHSSGRFRKASMDKAVIAPLFPIYYIFSRCCQPSNDLGPCSLADSKLPLVPYVHVNFTPVRCTTRLPRLAREKQPENISSLWDMVSRLSSMFSRPRDMLMICLIPSRCKNVVPSSQAGSFKGGLLITPLPYFWVS